MTRGVRRRRGLALTSAAALAAGAAVAVAWIAASGGFSALRLTRFERPGLLLLLLAGSTASMAARFVRWQFLLRRIDVRVPARRSLTIYLASLVGTATPAYLGELVRGPLLRRGFGVPLRATWSALVAERLLDVAALALLGLATSRSLARAALLASALAGVAVIAALLTRAARSWGVPVEMVRRLVAAGTLAPALVLSVLAWSAAAALLPLVAAAAGVGLAPADGAHVFAGASLAGGLTLMPAGVGATGSAAIAQLTALAVPLATAVAMVTVLRLTTAGLWLPMSALFLAVELLRRREASGPPPPPHFDEIAAEYRRQFADHVWDHLLARKVGLLAEALADRGRVGGAAPGLDLGCGLGVQAGALARLGYRVVGLDPAIGLLRRARVAGGEVLAADALRLPFVDGSLDFVYAIGVLHHLPSEEAQEAACREVARVLRPGGRFVVHETNPRNPLFRFYMGYVFPLLRSIDEGTELWLDPERWRAVPALRHVETRWFTFLPDFAPRRLMRPLAALERRLESGPLRRSSVHYMAVLEKPAATARSAAAPAA